MTTGDPLQLALLALPALIAGFIRGYTGFGGPAVLTLMLLPFFPPMLVVPKVVLVDLLSNVRLVPEVYRMPAWRRIWPWLLAGMLTVPAGHLLARQLEPDLVRRAVGVLVTICAGVMLAGYRLDSRPPGWVGAALSAASGVLMGGVYIALTMMCYLFSLPQSAADSRAQAIAWAFATGAVLAVFQFFTGSFGAGDLLPTTVLACAYLGGSVVGARSFVRASERTVRRAVLWLLVLLALVAMLV